MSNELFQLRSAKNVPRARRTSLLEPGHCRRCSAQPCSGPGTIAVRSLTWRCWI